MILLGRLLEQQRREHQVLRSAAALRPRRRSVAEHEILELHEIRATLASKNRAIRPGLVC
ncbi:hypothetical protein LRP76_07975 [Burkholderia pseudomallei]|uniref:hypothetical protein n=1 Tax=Burkholderia pseudomallei TaxID=28450 RepID=UPI000976F8E4|nr:hypothetical protein [Burkholderia pseudomallei]MCD4518517.1 hypothetical protein [Burkholderia pseudomallei]PPF06747.1 hypothetical protein B9D88_013905 [Burkholderia pseudomallei]